MQPHPDRWKTCKLKACSVHKKCCQLPCIYTMQKPAGPHPDGSPRGAEPVKMPGPGSEKLPHVAVWGGGMKILTTPLPLRAISPSSV